MAYNLVSPCREQLQHPSAGRGVSCSQVRPLFEVLEQVGAWNCVLRQSTSRMSASFTIGRDICLLPRSVLFSVVLAIMYPLLKKKQLSAKDRSCFVSIPLKETERKDYLTSILSQFINMICKWFIQMFQIQKVVHSAWLLDRRETVRVCCFDRAERISEGPRWFESTATVLYRTKGFPNVVSSSCGFGS